MFASRRRSQLQNSGGGAANNNMITTVESLRHRSSLKQLEFVLCATSPLRELAEEIRKHNDFGAVVHDISVTTTTMSNGSGDQPDWTSPAAHHFFAALGELAPLQSITLRGLSALPLTRLTQLLGHIQRARSLRAISVQHVEFLPSNNQQETIELVAALVHLKRLKHFEWQEQTPTRGRGSVLKQNYYIWNVIFRQSQLETICLKECTGNDNPGGTTTTTTTTATMGQIVRRDAVEKLCDSMRLEECTLFHFCIGAHALTGMARKLQLNQNLRVLNLDLRYTAQPGIVALWDMFRHNASINTCELWIPARKSCGLRHLAQCLKENTTLLVMVLKSDCPTTTTTTTTTTTPHHTTVVSDEDALAFVTMLEANPFGPITLDLDRYRGTYAPLVQLHTHLNVERKQHGNDDELRIASPETVTRRIWNMLLLTAVTAEKPVSSLYRFNALFSILQQHPTVITTATCTTTGTCTGICMTEEEDGWNVAALERIDKDTEDLRLWYK